MTNPVPPSHQPTSPDGYPLPAQAPGGYPPPGQPAVGYPAAAGYPGQPHYPPHYAPQPTPQIIIQNSAAASAFAGGYGGMRKRQSFGVHVLLFLFTFGFGNVLYAWYVIDWNRKRGL